jgi:hypothetical protein
LPQREITSGRINALVGDVPRVDRDLQRHSPLEILAQVVVGPIPFEVDDHRPTGGGLRAQVDATLHAGSRSQRVPYLELALDADDGKAFRREKLAQRGQCRRNRTTREGKLRGHSRQ